MDRRKFLQATAGTGLTLAGGGTQSVSAAVSSGPALMKLGDQTAPTSETHVKYPISPVRSVSPTWPSRATARR